MRLNDEFIKIFHHFTIFFTIFFMIFLKEAKIHDIWHKFMKNYEFWCMKKSLCPGKEFIYGSYMNS